MNEAQSRALSALLTRVSPARLLLVIALAIFTVEAGIMSLMHLVPLPYQPEGFTEALVDGLLLVVLLSPVLYHLFFWPLIIQIEQRRGSEEALQKERDKLETVTENLGAGLAIISRDYKTLWSNRVIRDIFGDVRDLPCYESFNEKTDVCPGCGVKEMFETGKDRVVHEQRGTDLDGGTIWSEIIVTPLRAPDGTVQAALELVFPITQRKLAEEAVEFERNRLRSILDAMEDGACIVGGDRTVEYANPVMVREFGAPEGRKCYQYFPGRQEVCPWCEDGGLHRKEHDKWEWRNAPKGRAYEVFGTTLTDAQGNLSRLEMLHDVTERRRAEEAVERERNRLRGILDGFPGGVYIVNDRYEIQYINPALETEFGPTNGRKCFEYFHERSEACPWCKNAEVFSGKTVRWQFHVLKSGKTYDLFDTPYKNDDGTVSKLEFFNDITEMKEVERALRQKEALLSNVLETLPVGVWITDEKGTLVRGNKAALAIWGGVRYVGPEEYGQYKAWWSSTGEIVAPEEWAAARAIRKGEVALNEEVDIECFDGTRKTILNSAVPIRNEAGEIVGAIVVNQDITNRKRMELHLIESEGRLRDLSAQILRAQEEERKRISLELHDELGQALTLLKIRMRFIEKKLRGDQTALKQECKDNLAYVDRIIEDVRRLSRDLSPSILQDLGLSAALRRLIEDFATHYRITDVVVDIGDVDRFFSSKAQIIIYRVFQEALTNIGKHANARRVAISAFQGDKVVSFIVEDDGDGFDVETTFSGSAVDKGLGLAAMGQRVKMLGGTLHLTSSRDRGTRIAFTVPLERE